MIPRRGLLAGGGGGGGISLDTLVYARATSITPAVEGVSEGQGSVSPWPGYYNDGYLLLAPQTSASPGAASGGIAAPAAQIILPESITMDSSGNIYMPSGLYAVRYELNCQTCDSDGVSDGSFASDDKLYMEYEAYSNGSGRFDHNVDRSIGGDELARYRFYSLSSTALWLDPRYPEDQIDCYFWVGWNSPTAGRHLRLHWKWEIMRLDS